MDEPETSALTDHDVVEVFDYASALSSGSSTSGSDVPDHNQWNAMLEMRFPSVVARRFFLAASPRCVAPLSATCTFACDLLNGPREHQRSSTCSTERVSGPTPLEASTTCSLREEHGR